MDHSCKLPITLFYLALFPIELVIEKESGQIVSFSLIISYNGSF